MLTHHESSPSVPRYVFAHGFYIIHALRIMHILSVKVGLYRIAIAGCYSRDFHPVYYNLNIEPRCLEKKICVYVLCLFCDVF